MEPSQSLPGLNQNSPSPKAEIGSQKVNLKSRRKVLIPAQSTIAILAYPQVKDLCSITCLGYVYPKQLGKRSLVLIEAIVPVKQQECQVLISNYGNQPVLLKKDEKVGFIRKATKLPNDEERVTAQERSDRIRFLTEKIESLRVKILENQQDICRIVDSILQNSSGELTFSNNTGCTDCCKFRPDPLQDIILFRSKFLDLQRWNIFNMELLDTSNVITVWNLTSGYHAMTWNSFTGKAIDSYSKNIRYNFLRMSFGLSIAPAMFCQLLILAYQLFTYQLNRTNKSIYCYMDDILIQSTIDERFVELD